MKGSAEVAVFFAWDKQAINLLLASAVHELKKNVKYTLDGSLSYV